MSETPLSDQINTETEDALTQLAWAIESSVGEFTLLLARCNYTQWRDRLAARLQQICPVEIHRLDLQPSELKLHARIRAEFGDTTPSALMVFGLEAVSQSDRLFSSANQVREEFRRRFPFPLVLWVDDDLLKIMWRTAPDFLSWAVSVAFPAPPEAIGQFLAETAQAWFANSLPLSRESALQLQTELGAAQQDLDDRSTDVAPEIAANLASLQGAVKLVFREIDAALTHYQNAAQLWQQCQNSERLGRIYLEIAHCHYIQARQQRDLKNWDWQPMREAVAQCLAAYEQAANPQLIADSLAILGKILRQLGEWDSLQTLAQNALPIHEQQHQTIEIARDYGFLAEVALAQESWSQAQELATKALEILQPAPDHPNSDASRYYFIIAQAEVKLNQPAQAIADLEAAKAAGNPDEDIQLYIQILCQLQGLYFQQQQYLDAFELKLTRQSVEQQYGLRSFVGACWIQPHRQGNITGENRETIPLEMTASGRSLDLDKLITRINSNDSKIIVIHGQSGVGKSSLVSGGLVPKLKQQSIWGEDYLPVLVRVYQDWTANLGRSLAAALAEKNVAIPPFDSEDMAAQLALLLQEFKKNEQRKLRTVLIFDQFEEFFFIHQKPPEQHQFFEFLGDCLQILSLKVILSLRVDYLHYLLVCDFLETMNNIGNDILAAKVRYHIGNFSVTDAAKIIKGLTAQAQSQFDDDLITALVADLAKGLNAVRPIELQIVGAQLEAEQITTLAEYRAGGSKTEFVQRYLAAVVADCGPENQKTAELVLYLLTDEKGTRPLKTRDEIERDVQALAVDSPQETNPLSIVLEIFVKSGLVLLLPEKPAERYQLVHDYLAEFIHQQQQPRWEELVAQLEAERKQRQKAEQENQILGTAHQKAQKRIRIGAGFLTFSFIVAVITGVSALKASQDRQEAQQILQEARVGAGIERQGLNVLRQFEVYPFEGLVSAMQAGQELKALVGDRPLADYPTTKPMEVLHTILRDIRERNQLNHQYPVISASFSPDGQRIVTASSDKTARVWDTTGKLVAELKGHQYGVNSASFSPDGQRIVTTSYDNTARLWDTTGTVVAELKGHQGGVISASFSPDGELVVTASDDKTARLWDTTGKLVAELKHQGGVNSASFSPDGQRIVTVSWDNTARLWDITGQLVAELKGHQGGVISASFSPDGELVVTASSDKTARLWDTTGTVVAELKHQDDVSSASFSPDGQRIVTASLDNTARLWDITGKLVAELKGHQGPVNSASFSPDGQRIVTASSDNTARLWDTTGKLVAELKGHQGPVNSASFSPDGQRIITASEDHTARVWDTTDTVVAELKGHQGSVYSASFSPDGQRIVTASDDKTARLWGTTGKRVAELKGHQREVRSASFSPDGQRIVTASYDNTARLWDTTGTVVAELKHQGWVNSASFSPDGELVVTASSDKTARLWDTTGTVVAELKGHQDTVNSASFSPDGQRIVTASEDKTARIWDSTGTVVAELKGHQDRVISASFSPDGQRIVTASWDNTARLWDTTGKLVAELIGHQDTVISASFSPDGQHIVTASSDNTARVWDTTGKLVAELIGHQDTVNSASFSPDGQRMVTTSYDKTARVWDTTGKLLAELKGHQDTVNSASFSPDGQRIVTASSDNTARVWRVGTLDELLEWGCEWLQDYLVSHPSELEKLKTCQ